MAESIVGGSTKQSLTTYDVFLNHRGPDTKENFVIPLQKKLREKGIESFVDRQAILHGQNLFTTIEEAIRRAHMHVAIFSQTYAQSTYCLKELHQMVVSRKPIVTVFYDVEPEHVRRPRRPNGPYEVAFQKHDVRENEQDVQVWVSALQGCADIRGLRRSDYGTDDELAKAIVDEVVKIRSPEELIVPAREGEYDWKSHYYKLPAEGSGVLLFAGDSHGYQLRVSLSSEPRVTYPNYEIVIRAGVNLKSAIRRNTLGGLFQDVCCVPGVVSDPNFGTKKHYWLSIDADTQLIQVGSGTLPELASVFCVYKDPDFIGTAQYVAFSSGEEPVTYSDISVTSLSFFSLTGSDLMSFLSKEVSSMSMAETQLDNSSLPLVVRPKRGHFDWSTYSKLVSEGRGFFLFAAEASNDVHVAISPRPEVGDDPFYHIVIGGHFNTISGIRRGRNAPYLCRVPTGLINTHRGGLNQFWVSINADTKLILVGRGNQPHLASIFCICKDINFIREARYVCFTSWDVPVTYSNISVGSQPIEIAGDSDCPVRKPSNERILEPCPMRGVYDWTPRHQLLTRGRGFVTFAAKGTNDVYVAISPEPRSMDPMYEIVIGGWSNTRSVIRRRSQGPPLCTVVGGLDMPKSDAWNHLWVSIDKKTKLIQIGRGKQLDLSSVFCAFKDRDFLRRAQYVCFSSWGSPVAYSDIAVGPLKGAGFMCGMGGCVSRWRSEMSEEDDEGFWTKRPQLVHGFAGEAEMVSTFMYSSHRGTTRRSFL